MLWYSFEAPRRGASNEYPQHMFLLRNKKAISIFWMKKAPYLLLCSGLIPVGLNIQNVTLEQRGSVIPHCKWAYKGPKCQRQRSQNDNGQTQAPNVNRQTKALMSPCQNQYVLYDQQHTNKSFQDRGHDKYSFFHIIATLWGETDGQEFLQEQLSQQYTSYLIYSNKSFQEAMTSTRFFYIIASNILWAETNGL